MQSTHLTLECRDVAAGATFFRDVLAFPVHQRDPRSAEVRLGDLTATLTQVHPELAVVPSPEAGDETHLGEHPGERTPCVILEVRVPDVAAAVREVRRRGGRVLIEPMITEWGTESAFIEGPDGVIVELFRPRDL